MKHRIITICSISALVLLFIWVIYSSIAEPQLMLEPVRIAERPQIPVQEPREPTPVLEEPMIINEAGYEEYEPVYEPAYEEFIEEILIDSHMQVRLLVEPKWDFVSVSNFSDGIGSIGSWGYGWYYVNLHGEIINPTMPSSRNIGFSEGLVVIHSEEYESVAFMDMYGNVVVPFGWLQYARSFSEGMAAVKIDGLWGFIDTDGSMRIPAQYDWAGCFSEGLAAVSQNSLWGFIDSSGELVIPFQFEMQFITCCCARYNSELAAIPYFSNGAARISAVNWDAIESLWDSVRIQDRVWTEETAANLRRLGAMQTELWGFIDKHGNQITPFVFASARDFSEGLAAVSKTCEESGSWIFGFIDMYGNEVVPIKYSNVGNFNHGIATVQLACLEYERWPSGIIDISGNIVLPIEYDQLSILSDDLIAFNERCPERDRWVRSIKNLQTNEIIATGFTSIGAYSDGWMAVSEDWDVWQFMNRYGHIRSQRFRNAEKYSEGLAAFSLGGWDGPWGFIDIYGNVAVHAVYNRVHSFNEGRAWVRQGDFWGLLEVVELGVK